MTKQNTQDDFFGYPDSTEQTVPAEKVSAGTAESAAQSAQSNAGQPAPQAGPVLVAESPVPQKPLIFSEQQPQPTRSLDNSSKKVQNKRQLRDEAYRKKFEPLSMNQVRESDTIGMILRGGRTAAGFSISEVSEITHIGSTFLEMLEDDKPGRLPAAVYVSAYLNTLGKLYRFDTDLMEHLRILHSSHGPAHDVSQALLEQLCEDAMVNAEEEKKVTRIFIAIAAVVGLSIIFGIWAVVAAVFSYAKQTAEEQELAQQQEIQQVLNAPSAVPSSMIPFDARKFDDLNPPVSPELDTLEVKAHPAVRKK